MLTVTELNDSLNYDPLTGTFTWKAVLPRSSARVGDLAGSITKSGRLQLSVKGYRYYAHQLAWLAIYEEIPTRAILHKDKNYLNNAISNLELASDVRQPLTQKLLQELFDYNEDSGLLTRLKGVGGSTYSGEVVGHVHGRRGYRVVIVNGKPYQAHRLVWLLKTGDLPDAEIDHINGNRADNSWGNLRLATKEQNQHNAKLRSDNKSGVKGMKRNRDYLECRVAHEGEVAYKCFKASEEDLAIAWLRETRMRLHGEFANHG
jgi:hypothetical protein